MLENRNAPRTCSVILGGGRGTRLYPLTKMRAKPAVPLGGKYRLIDVPISNCLNSGLNKIYVLTQFESTSLHRHVKWSYVFDRFGGGFVEILAAQQTYESSDWYQGTADAVRQNLTNFGDDYDEFLILSGDQLYRMNFHALLGNHRRAEADMSIAVLPVAAKETSALGILKVDKTGRVVGFHEKPSENQLQGLETAPELFKEFGIEAKGRPYLASMGIYVFNTRVLFDELIQNRHVDFGKHVFPAALGKYRIQAHLFDGYWEDIGTVKSFHEANIALAKQPATFSFDAPEGPIYTRPRSLAGTVAGRLSIADSIVADGCRVQEATLDHSILGIRSIVGKNVRLDHTLVMGADFYEPEAQLAANKKSGIPDIGIGSNVVIEHAIVDKNARIGNDVIIKNPNLVQPVDGPGYAVRDGVICIFKGAVIPNGTRIGVA